MGLATNRNRHNLKDLAFIGGWALLLLTGVFSYLPGLSGPFVLDDVLNIATLGDHGGVANWETFKAFVFGGHSGPTGRPVSLLTFLIDATNWPAEPYSFKRTNLIVHLANGALLGVLVSQILRLLQYESTKARWMVIVCVACWLLHPFLVSTTLYVVQRMAQLSTFFVFAGLVGFLYGRSFIVANQRKAYLIMTSSIGLFTVLATLSKENGILLPLLAGVLEFTIVASQGSRLGKLNKHWSTTFFVIPAVVIVVYLGSRVVSGGFFDLAPSREFSTYERLLTQSRALADYLWHWFVPDMYTPGVFQDHFIKSSGWLSPATTLLSTFFHTGVIAVAVTCRRKWPLLALAALFFYVSHVLESTVLNLELYFEHRNYLASAFLFLPVVVALHNRLHRRYFALAAAGLLLMLAGFTRYSATVWSDYSRMVVASAKMAPASVRAQARYATILFDSQQYEESLRVLDRAIADIPGRHTDLLVNRLVILCSLGALDEAEFNKTSVVISDLYFNPGKFFLFRAFVNGVAQKRCPGLPVESLRPLFVKMLEVPANADPQNLPYSLLNYLLGFIDVHAGNASSAEAAFKRSLNADPSAYAAMRVARLLASNEFYDEALKFAESALAQLRVEEQAGFANTADVAAEIRVFQASVIDDRGARRDGETADQDQ